MKNSMVWKYFVYSLFSKKRQETPDEGKSFSFQKQEYFDFNLIGKYFYDRTKNDKSDYQILSDRVVKDLDFHEVFSAIDRTISKNGQQYFYYKLRTFKGLNADFQKFSKLADLLKEDNILQDSCAKRLKKLQSRNAYYWEELQHEELYLDKKLLIFAILSNIFLIFIIISAFKFIWILLILAPLVAAKLFFHYKNKQYIEYYIIKIRELSKAVTVAQKLKKERKFNDFLPNFHFPKLNAVNRKLRYLTWESSLANSDMFLIIWIFFELLRIVLSFEIFIFSFIIKDLNSCKEEIKNLFTTLGELDSAISVACLSTEFSLCKPQFIGGKKINAEEIYHPLIKNCVPNSLNLSDKSLLLTGSNMSGKTTFIRIFALNVIFSQTVNRAFALKFEIPYFKLFTSIRIEDNLANSRSFYLDEVLTVKEFIEAARNKEEFHLFVMDEIFKGTNTVERIAIGKAVLSYLNTPNNFIFASTHDIELCDFLIGKDYLLYHFSESIYDEKLFFDYKLKTGKLATQNAIKILELYQYPKEIVEKARLLSKDNGGIQNLLGKITNLDTETED